MWIEAMRNYSVRERKTQTETERSDSDNELFLGSNVVRISLMYLLIQRRHKSLKFPFFDKE